MKNNTQPEVRFAGYMGIWEQRKLGGIADVTKLAGFEFTKYISYLNEGRIIALRGLNVKNGQLVLDEVKYIDQSDFTKLTRSKLYKDDILFTYVGTIGELAVVPENDKYYLAPNVARIRLFSNINPQFISQMMNNNIFYNKIIYPLIATSSQPALSMENVRKFTLNLPLLEEQKKLGSFFKQFDDTIALQQRKLKCLKDSKQGFLQKMFPKDGECVPELRFVGFADDWEQRKLGEVADFFDEKRIPIDSEKRRSGRYPYYGASGVIDYVEGYIFDGDYVLLAEDGANITMRNSPIAYITEGKFWLNNHAHIMKIKYGSNRFLLQLLEKQNYERYNSGTAQPKLNGQVVKKITLSFPNKEEQQKIGTFFNQLDDNIALHEKELKLLKQTKKAFLQKMFV